MTEIGILYRDEDVVVVDKPPRLLTHRSRLAGDRDVAMTRARDTIGAYVYPVHRLDRQTSGALLFALNEDAARALRTAFDNGEVHKTYLAIARGETPAECLIDYAVPNDENGQRVDARTRLRTLHVGSYFSIVEACPETGRYHQIRRHMSHLRHPLACDSNYGTGWFNRKIRQETGLARLALHAASLSFPHPKGDRLLIRCPLPSDLAQAFRALDVPAGSFENLVSETDAFSAQTRRSCDFAT